VLLDDHAAVVGDMAPAGGQERGPSRDVIGVDQVRRQQDHVEAAAERQVLDPRAHRLGTVYVRQHLRRLVDGDDRVAERDQRMGDPPGPAAQLEDPGPGSSRVVHDLGLAPGGHPRVEVNGAAVRSDHSRSGSCRR
jgi:hypothetical protein